MKYDIAQICENGHVINAYYHLYPENNQNFCSQCGASTINSCPACRAPIRGNLLDSFSRQFYQPPKFCFYCGNAFPWTAAALQAVNEFTQGLENINEDEKSLLISSLQDLIYDAPSTNLAIPQIRNILQKIGSVAADMVRDILVDVLSEAAKKALFP